MSDPQKREIYDLYGEEGLMMYEQGMFGEEGELLQVLPFLENPSNYSISLVLTLLEVYLTCFCFLGFLMLCIAALVPIFVVLKLDEVVDWNWGVVFIPLWIVNVVPSIFSIINLVASERKFRALILLIQYICLLIFQILLAVQLQKGREDEFKWGLAFIPIYVLLGLHVLKKVITNTPAVFHEKEKTEMALFGLNYIGYLIRNLVSSGMAILFMILLTVKLDEDPYSWWIVSIPIFIYMAWLLFIRCADGSKSISHSQDAEEKSKKRTVLCGMTFVFSLFLAFALTFVILAVVKLDGAGYSVAIVVIPIFIIMGCLLCCCCCCGPCLICCRGEDENPDFYAQAGSGEDAENPPFENQKRIEEPEPQVKKPTEQSPLKDID